MQSKTLGFGEALQSSEDALQRAFLPALFQVAEKRKPVQGVT